MANLINILYPDRRLALSYSSAAGRLKNIVDELMQVANTILFINWWLPRIAKMLGKQRWKMRTGGQQRKVIHKAVESYALPHSNQGHEEDRGLSSRPDPWLI